MGDLRTASAGHPRRSRALAAVVVGLAVLGALAAAAGPVVRGLASARAERMGLTVAIEHVGLGWGTLRLSDLDVAAPELPFLRIHVRHVEVAPGLSLAPRWVAAHGVSISVDGELDAVHAALRAYRAAHDTAPAAPAGPARSIPVAVDGVDAAWTRAEPGAPTQHAWGLRYVRDADGRESLGVDLLRASLRGLSVEVADGAVELGHAAGRRVVTRVGAASVAAALDLDRGAPEPAPGAVVSAGAAAQAPAVGAIATGGTLAEPPSPAAPPAASAEGRGPAVRARIARGATAVAELLAVPSELSLAETAFVIHHAGESLRFGPATLTVGRDASTVRLGVTSGAGRATAPLGLALSVPLAEGPVAVHLAGGPVSLAALGVREGDMGLSDVQRAEVEVDGEARLSADGREVALSGRSRLSGLSISQPKLAPEPVRGLTLSLGGRARVSTSGDGAHLDDVELGVGRVKLSTTGELRRAEGHAQGELHVRVPLTACSDLLGAVPRALVPQLAGVGVAGTFALAADLAFDTRRPGDTRVGWDVANECRVTRVPEAIAPQRFSRPWVRTVLDAASVETTIESGPGTPDWVPAFDVSPYMATAVVVCEDASFFSHGGFNAKSIQDSIRDNLKAGRFVRGASTVTMQLAKNLYLGREKTLSRKLQEAVLTLLLEQALTKEQILELYLNVIEFSPGQYGIGPAARHYFATRPRDLSLAQAFYLVSILPNPRVHHFQPDGSLSPTWTEYLRHLMRIARKIGRIDDHELEAGLAEELRFGQASPSAAGQADPGSAPPDVMELMPREAGEDDEAPAPGP